MMDNLKKIICQGLAILILIPPPIQADPIEFPNPPESLDQPIPPLPGKIGDTERMNRTFLPEKALIEQLKVKLNSDRASDWRRNTALKCRETAEENGCYFSDESLNFYLDEESFHYLDDLKLQRLKAVTACIPGEGGKRAKKSYAQLLADPSREKIDFNHGIVDTDYARYLSRYEWPRLGEKEIIDKMLVKAKSLENLGLLLNPNPLSRLGNTELLDEGGLSLIEDIAILEARLQVAAQNIKGNLTEEQAHKLMAKALNKQNGTRDQLNRKLRNKVAQRLLQEWIAEKGGGSELSIEEIEALRDDVRLKLTLDPQGNYPKIEKLLTQTVNLELAKARVNELEGALVSCIEDYQEDLKQRDLESEAKALREKAAKYKKQAEKESDFKKKFDLTLKSQALLHQADSLQLGLEIPNPNPGPEELPAESLALQEQWKQIQRDQRLETRYWIRSPQQLVFSISEILIEKNPLSHLITTTKTQKEKTLLKLGEQGAGIEDREAYAQYMDRRIASMKKRLEELEATHTSLKLQLSALLQAEADLKNNTLKLSSEEQSLLKKIKPQVSRKPKESILEFLDRMKLLESGQVEGSMQPSIIKLAKSIYHVRVKTEQTLLQNNGVEISDKWVNRLVNEGWSAELKRIMGLARRPMAAIEHHRKAKTFQLNTGLSFGKRAIRRGTRFAAMANACYSKLNPQLDETFIGKQKSKSLYLMALVNQIRGYATLKHQTRQFFVASAPPAGGCAKGLMPNGKIDLDHPTIEPLYETLLQDFQSAPLVITEKARENLIHAEKTKIETQTKKEIEKFNEINKTLTDLGAIWNGAYWDTDQADYSKVKNFTKMKPVFESTEAFGVYRVLGSDLWQTDIVAPLYARISSPRYGFTFRSPRNKMKHVNAQGKVSNLSGDTPEMTFGFNKKNIVTVQERFTWEQEETFLDKDTGPLKFTSRKEAEERAKSLIRETEAQTKKIHSHAADLLAMTGSLIYKGEKQLVGNGAYELKDWEVINASVQIWNAITMLEALGDVEVDLKGRRVSAGVAAVVLRVDYVYGTLLFITDKLPKDIQRENEAFWTTLARQAAIEALTWMIGSWAKGGAKMLVMISKSVRMGARGMLGGKVVHELVEQIFFTGANKYATIPWTHFKNTHIGISTAFGILPLANLHIGSSLVFLGGRESFRYLAGPLSMISVNYQINRRIFGQTPRASYSAALWTLPLGIDFNGFLYHIQYFKVRPWQSAALTGSILASTDMGMALAQSALIDEYRNEFGRKIDKTHLVLLDATARGAFLNALITRSVFRHMRGYQWIDRALTDPNFKYEDALLAPEHWEFFVENITADELFQLGKMANDTNNPTQAARAKPFFDFFPSQSNMEPNQFFANLMQLIINLKEPQLPAYIAIQMMGDNPEIFPVKPLSEQGE